MPQSRLFTPGATGPIGPPGPPGPAGGGMTPSFETGFWYDNFLGLQGFKPIAAGSQNFPNNTLFFVQTFIHEAITLDRISINLIANVQPGAETRIGIYDDLNYSPNNLLVDSGVIDCSVAGVKEVIINTPLLVGWHWLAFLTNNPLPRYKFFDGSGSAGYRQFITPFTSSVDVSTFIGFTQIAAQIYGALPAVAGAVQGNASAGGNMPRIMFRVQ